MNLCESTRPHPETMASSEPNFEVDEWDGVGSFTQVLGTSRKNASVALDLASC